MKDFKYVVFEQEDDGCITNVVISTKDKWDMMHRLVKERYEREKQKYLHDIKELYRIKEVLFEED